MNRKHFTKNNAGTTMVELVIATAIFGFTMSMLVGTVITMTGHNAMTDQRAQMASFNRSALEDLRGRTLNDILTYQIPLDDREAGTVNIPGVGESQAQVFAVVVDPQTGERDLFELGVDDPDLLVNVPNPLEIVINVQKASSSGYGSMNEQGGEPVNYPSSVNQSMSTLIAY